MKTNDEIECLERKIAELQANLDRANSIFEGIVGHQLFKGIDQVSECKTCGFYCWCPNACENCGEAKPCFDWDYSDDEDKEEEEEQEEEKVEKEE